AREIRAELSAQVGAPVRFVDQIESMYAAGARVFVETGPGSVLTGLVGAILGDRPHLAVPCDGGPRVNGEPRGDGGSRGDGGLRGFLGAVARLAMGGLPVRTGWLYAGRDARDVTGTTPPPPPGWTVDGHLVRTRDGACMPGGL